MENANKGPKIVDPAGSELVFTGNFSSHQLQFIFNISNCTEEMRS